MSTGKESKSVQMASFVTQLKFADLPKEVVQKAKMQLIDTLGIGLAASEFDFARMVVNVVTNYGGTPASTMIGYQQKVPAHYAALANGTMAHGLDFDDTHSASIVHVSAAVVPAALAAGEAAGRSGKEVIAAAVAGYELITRIGMAAPGKFHDGGYHATPICGIFGATAIAAKLKGLSESQMANALGICGSQASGIQEFLNDGTWVKRIHPAWAAHSGLIAADLAEQGFTGPVKVLEGRFGLFATHVGLENFDPEVLVKGLGTKWETLQISFKPYPCCHLLHAFMDAALVIKHEQGLRVEDIVDIECHIHETEAQLVCKPEEAKMVPATMYAAMFSLPYSVAVYLLDEKAGLDQFSDEKIKNGAILSLAQKVRYVVDNSMNFPKYFPGRVIIKTRQGQRFEREELINRGHVERPLSWEEVVAKYRENAGRCVPGDRVEQILNVVDRLEEVPDIGELMALLRVHR